MAIADCIDPVAVAVAAGAAAGRAVAAARMVVAACNPHRSWDLDRS